MRSIRCSLLPGYPDCPRRAAAKQFLKDITSKGFSLRETSPSVGAAAGTATHHVAAELLKAKWAEKQISMDDALEPAIVGFREEVGKGCEWDDTSPNANVAEGQIRKMSEEYRRGVLPYVDPLTVQIDGEDAPAVEMYLESTIHPNRWKLTGTTDLVDITYAVHDTKTGSRGRPYYAQLGAYSLNWRSNGYPETKSLMIDYIKRCGKTKDQAPVVTTEYPVQASERAAWAVITDIIRDHERFMETGDPYCFPFNTMSLLCNPKYCVAYKTDFCQLSGVGDK